MADIRLGLKEPDNGTYLLVLRLKEDQDIQPGKLQRTNFRHGIYLYIGRARRALLGRIERHLRKEKKLFWHIDYFLQKAEVEEIWIKQDFLDECQVVRKANNFSKDTIFPLKKFGSSDCRCFSHLIYLPGLKVNLKSLRKKLGFEEVLIHGN